MPEASTDRQTPTAGSRIKPMGFSERVTRLLSSMSVEEKAGQVFIFTHVSQAQALHDLRLNPGGYVRIYSDVVTLARQAEELQAEARTPLIISADFERGIGSTVSGAVDMVGNMCLGASNDERLAYDVGRAISEEAMAMGVNMNYVPVMDVNVNPDNPIINIRAYGSDPDLVARLGAAFIRGSRDAGILTCAKHFPGHGDTSTDTHSSLAVIDKTRAQLDAVELRPFRAAIDAGVDSIMSAHIAMPQIDPEGVPATLSRRVLTDLLRGEMGFDGMVVSDALEMGAITRHFTPREAIVRAFNAGVDQLIMPTDNERSVRTLVDAVRSGEVTEDRLDEAVGRILTAKERAGILDRPYRVPQDLSLRVNTPEHRGTALDAALAGITLVRDSAGFLPLSPGTRVAVVSMSNSEDGRTYFTEPRSFGAHCARQGLDARWVHCGSLAESAVHEHGVLERAQSVVSGSDIVIAPVYARVVIASGTVALEQRFVDFLRELSLQGRPLVVVAFGNPYMLNQLPFAAAAIAAYGSSEALQEAAAMLVAGHKPFRGVAPVPLD